MVGKRPVSRKCSNCLLCNFCIARVAGSHSELMFKFLPDAKIKWKHVWIGSIFTAFLFGIGKFGLGLYFGKLNPEIGYGAAGSIILIMLWVSYSSMIVFFGAEFTRAYADFISGRVAPTEIAKTDIQDKPI
jgi:membrane protein